MLMWHCRQTVCARTPQKQVDLLAVALRWILGEVQTDSNPFKIMQYCLLIVLNFEVQTKQAKINWLCWILQQCLPVAFAWITVNFSSLNSPPCLSTHTLFQFQLTACLLALFLSEHTHPLDHTPCYYCLLLSNKLLHVLMLLLSAVMLVSNKLLHVNIASVYSFQLVLMFTPFNIAFTVKYC